MDKKVEIKKPSTAGTVESNDILIMLSKNKKKSIEIELESVVEKQYGSRIQEVIQDTLKEKGVTSARVVAKDKGALDFTIRARVKAALERSIGDNDEL